MVQNLRVLSCLLFVSLMSFSKKEKEIWINYPSQLGVIQTCIGEEAEVEISITTNSEKKIEVYSFDPGITEYTLISNGKEVKKGDTLYFKDKSPLKLTLKYKIENQSPDTLRFNTNQTKYAANKICLFYGQYNVPTKAIREKEDLVINVSSSCSDSIKLCFPYGGTVTSATLYSESNTEKYYKSIGYFLGDPSNYLYISESDTGKYIVIFSSCHWESEFCLTIK